MFSKGVSTAARRSRRASTHNAARRSRRDACRAFVLLCVAACVAALCGCEFASDATVLFRGPSADAAVGDAAALVGDSGERRDTGASASSNDAGDGGDRGNQVPLDRTEKLNHGLKVQEWIGGAQYDAGYFSGADLETMRTQGVRNLRIFFNMSSLFDENAPGVLKPAGLSNFDEVVDKVLRANLAVVVHPYPTDPRSWTNPAYVEKLVAFWQALAGHFVARDSDRIFLKLDFNPDAPRADDWYATQERLLRAIRAVDTNRTLLVTPNAFTRGGERNPLVAVRESLTTLDNVAYDFGFFSPVTFTHQGATWRTDESWLQYLHDLPYPSSEAACQPFLAGITDATARANAQSYCAENFDQSKLGALLAPLAQWANEKKVTLICGGFGVFKPLVSEASRLKWLSDTRAVFETAKIPWTVYSDGDFSVLETANGRRIEPAVATGLFPP